jgi:hypothetical protein
MVRCLNPYVLVTVGILAFLPVSCKSPVQELTIAVRHRAHLGYYEEFQVKMGQKFQLSDTDYYARAVDFVPDFAISLSDKKVFSRSDSLNNPAVKLIVYRGKEKLEEVWAFQKVEAPHFSPQSMLGFRLLDFKIEDQFKEVEDRPGKDD